MCRWHLVRSHAGRADGIAAGRAIAANHHAERTSEGMIFQRVGAVLVKKLLTAWEIVPKGLLWTDIKERGEKVPKNCPDCDEFLADLRCHLNASPN